MGKEVAYFGLAESLGEHRDLILPLLESLEAAHGFSGCGRLSILPTLSKGLAASAAATRYTHDAVCIHFITNCGPPDLDAFADYIDHAVGTGGRFCSPYQWPPPGVMDDTYLTLAGGQLSKSLEQNDWLVTPRARWMLAYRAWHAERGGQLTKGLASSVHLSPLTKRTRFDLVRVAEGVLEAYQQLLHSGQPVKEALLCQG